MKIIINMINPDQEPVLKLLHFSDLYYASLYPEESNHLLNIDSLMQENVSFLAAYSKDNLAGFGAIVKYNNYGEIKRMYVDPTYRGHGIGSLLLMALEQRGKSLGCEYLRLETGIRQPEAIMLYEKFGYSIIQPFGDYKLDPLSLFMEKKMK